MADVFISYARSTQPLAERVHGALTAAGYGVWRDSELAAHRAYSEMIEEELEAAKVVLTIWSPEAVKSQWVRSEANRARERGKLVQVSIDQCLPPMPFDQIHCADLSGWQGDARSRQWRHVLESLAAIIGAPQPIAPATPQPVRREPLLGVLAFDNLSGDPDFLYFSDGVSEEILHTVAKTTGLKVCGRMSSFQYRGAEKAPSHVAAELGCTHVLDGSVRRSGERVRVSAELIECAGQTTLWADRFDRELADVFALQDEIAEAVAAALKIAFAPSADTGPVDPAAYDLYLKARDMAAKGVPFVWDLLERAVRISPEFATAWAWLAFVRGTRLRFIDVLTPAAEQHAGIVKAADTALALDPGAGLAYAARALAEPLCGWDGQQMWIGKALEVAPNDSTILIQAASLRDNLGYQREALELAARAYEVDARISVWYYAWMLDVVGRKGLANEIFDRDIARWPDTRLLVANALRAAYECGDWERYDALSAAMDPEVAVAPVIRGLQLGALRYRTWTEESGAAFIVHLAGQVADTGTLGFNWLGLACSHGLTDQIYELVERASFERLFRPDGNLLLGELWTNTLFTPAFRAMREDIRFVRLCDRLGLCAYWLKTDRWPDFTEEVAPFYDLRAEARRLAAATV